MRETVETPARGTSMSSGASPRGRKASNRASSTGRAVRQRECAGKGHVHRSQRPPSGGPHPSPGGVGGVRKRQVVQTTSPFSKFSSSIIAEWAKCKKTTQSLRRATGAHDTHPVWGLSARAPDGMVKMGRGHPPRLGLNARASDDMVKMGRGHPPRLGF